MTEAKQKFKARWEHESETRWLPIARSDVARMVRTHRRLGHEVCRNKYGHLVIRAHRLGFVMGAV